MKWFPFVILAAIALVCQTTVASQVMAIHSIWPDLMFVLAVHYALWGPWPDAAIAAWLLGLVVGMYTNDPIGLHAFCYGAAAWGIMRLRQIVYCDHPITQFLVTGVFALGVQLIVWTYRFWQLRRGAGGSAAVLTWSELWWAAFFTAIYTAALAPYLHWPLIRMGRWTGLKIQRSRSRG